MRRKEGKDECGEEDRMGEMKEGERNAGILRGVIGGFKRGGTES